MGTRPPLQVRVRDSSLRTIGAVDDYVTVTAVPRFNAVGAFTLEIDAASDQAALMVEGNGLIVSQGATVVVSGPIRTVDWSRSSTDGGAGKLTVAGPSDDTVLAEATCWPDPTAVITAQTDPFYKIAGVVAGTAMIRLVNLNIGPSGQASRRITNLTMGADTGLGASVTRQVNQFDNLLANLQAIATAAGLGFRVVQIGTSLQFQVYTPADKSTTARFSFGLGNLTAASYTTTPPTVTKAVVVAGGQSTARVCATYTQADPLFPGLVIEQMVDATSVDTTVADLAAQMLQAGTEALAAGAGQGSLAITPVDIPQLAYGRDYNLGDKVAVMVRDTWITDVVREVTLTGSAADGTRLKATIGNTSNPPADVIARVYRYIGQIKADITRLKTRKAA
jgi:hypothetical protein